MVVERKRVSRLVPKRPAHPKMSSFRPTRKKGYYSLFLSSSIENIVCIKFEQLGNKNYYGEANTYNFNILIFKIILKFLQFIKTERVNHAFCVTSNLVYSILLVFQFSLSHSYVTINFYFPINISFFSLETIKLQLIFV